MRILLLGSQGMLGSAIQNKGKWFKNAEIFTVARNGAQFSMDLKDDGKLEECFCAVKPDAVINAAAIINLSLCENDVENAYRINARLCSIISQLCAKYKAYYVQISTDHYYRGDGEKKHKEDDPIYLCNEYARTKYLGECLAAQYNNSVILRTNIVGYKGDTLRPTFLEWIGATIHNEEPIFLYDDYYTSSMHTWQFIEVLSKIVELRPKGIFNVASREVVSKKEFVIHVAKYLYGRAPCYEVTSVTEKGDTVRANSLGLNVLKIESLLGCKMPDLEQVICSIFREAKDRNII